MLVLYSTLEKTFKAAGFTLKQEYQEASATSRLTATHPFNPETVKFVGTVFHLHKSNGEMVRLPRLSPLGPGLGRGLAAHMRAASLYCVYVGFRKYLWFRYELAEKCWKFVKESEGQRLDWASQGKMLPADLVELANHLAENELHAKMLWDMLEERGL